jgi:hypothetical protein
MSAIFGRKWQLTVTTTGGEAITANSEDSNGNPDPGALGMSFEITQTALAAVWMGYIEVLNLNEVTTTKLVGQGSVVSLQAGYEQGGGYGEIFRGKVLKAVFKRRNVVDFVVGLQCVVGGDFLVNSFVNFATGPGLTQQQYITQMAQAAGFTVNDPGNGLNTTTKLPRGGVFWGDPRKYLDMACRNQNLFYFPSAAGQVSITQFKVNSTTPTLTFAPPIAAGAPNQTPDPATTYSIIGTPSQVTVAGGMTGVEARVLCDPRLLIQNPPMVVKLSNTTLIDQSLLPISSDGVSAVPGTGLNTDGLYGLVSVTHHGDSRGNPWYSDILLLNLAGNTLVAQANQNADRRYISVNPQGGTSQ